ncbi:(2R)-phospho-3-sulfolactate synthase, ComA [Dillenia turbinata]|uniref:(2R)-phospho-3-sulfolactate synthase, ComA n=1 Tax=Dillenia turbinata TaxID=194707 RepID=A0AAN8USV1_9MAGN
MSAYTWKSFNEDGDRPEKPRRFGVTEMRGPTYNLLSQNLLQDIFESMGQFVDGLKFSGGSHSLMPKSFIKEVTDMAHKHSIYVSTGDWAEHLLRKGPSSFKEYVEECRNLGFDTIELNVGTLGVPEETLLRFVRLIKSGGLKAKPQFAVKFDKSDLPLGGDRAFGAYIAPVPRTSDEVAIMLCMELGNLQIVEDVDLLIRRAERCLEAGADMIMIDADDLCRHAESVRADVIAKVIARLGLEKTMFEASNAGTSEWFIQNYGPRVNLFVDHSQVMDLECLRGRNLGKSIRSVLDSSETEMPAVWFAVKRSLNCKPEPSDVHDPKNPNPKLSNIVTKKGCTSCSRLGCSRTISNLKDVIHGSKRHLSKPPKICSPRSIGSNEFQNPITHEVILNNSTCELQITSFGESNGYENESPFVATLRPGTPGPQGIQTPPKYNHRGLSTPPRKSPSSVYRRREGLRYGVGGSLYFGGIPIPPKSPPAMDSVRPSTIVCNRCHERFKKWEVLEEHHISKHAVTELVEGDSSRKIVEIICRTGWLKSESNSVERILKVHNKKKTLAQFEEYRETVKMKASKLAKKHPRCLADGNELLRFYGTTVTCSLGQNDSSSLCTSEKCNVCRILRHGFPIKKVVNGGVGIFTTSTSGRAFESVDLCEETSECIRKALVICRVIAGRVHKPLENLQEFVGQSGFDSLAGKIGVCSHIEELYLLNPRALLPCFVVIFKT